MLLIFLKMNPPVIKASETAVISKPKRSPNLMSVIRGILLQNSIVCGFSLSAYSNSGRFFFRFRLMPMRGFLFRFVVSLIHMVFSLSQGLAAVCSHIAPVFEGSAPWPLAAPRRGHRSIHAGGADPV